MKKLILIFLFVFVFTSLSVSSVFSEVNKDLQIRKQPEIQQVKPKKPVHIKLKRTAEGKYSWDLTGDDVDEIVRADKRLKKQLHLE
jgi:hypothetical protein